MLSFPKDALCLANFTVFRHQHTPLCVFAKRDNIAKYIKPLDFAKCWLKCLLAPVATEQLLSVGPVLYQTVLKPFFSSCLTFAKVTD